MGKLNDKLFKEIQEEHELLAIRLKSVLKKSYILLYAAAFFMLFEGAYILYSIQKKQYFNVFIGLFITGLMCFNIYNTTQTISRVERDKALENHMFNALSKAHKEGKIEIDG